MKRKPRNVDAVIDEAPASPSTSKGRSKFPAPGLQRMTFDLPTAVYQDLKILAATKRLPMRHLVEQWVTQGLARERTRRRTSK